MALYLVSYDIVSKDAFEYAPLWAHLKNIGAVRILYSEWVIVDSVGKSAHIYKDISGLVSLQDKLLVQEILRDANWDNLMISDDAFRVLLKSARG